MVNDGLSLPRGIVEDDPDDVERRLAVQRRLLDVARSYGFRPVEFAGVGFERTFTTGHHAATDRMYSFDDRGGRRLALLTDSLPAALRYIASRAFRDSRVAYTTPVYRYVHRAARNFHLAGLAEAYEHACDATREASDVERLLRVLSGFVGEPTTLTAAMTDLGVWRALVRELHGDDTIDERIRALSRLPDAARAGWLRERGAPTLVVRFAELVADHPTLGPCDGALDALLAALARPERERLELVVRLALRFESAGHARRAELTLGSFHAGEFHAGVAFRLRAGAGVRLGDGGAYGHFARAFLGRETTYNATAFHLERFAALEGAALSPAADVFVRYDDAPRVHELAQWVCHELRVAGLNVWDALATGKLAKHLRDADRLGASFVIVIGADEVARGSLRVRLPGGALEDVPRGGLVAWVRQRYAASAAGRTHEGRARDGEGVAPRDDPERDL